MAFLELSPEEVDIIVWVSNWLMTGLLFHLDYRLRDRAEEP